jgi:hypothetical protein
MTDIDEIISELKSRVDKAKREEMLAAQIVLGEKDNSSIINKEKYFNDLYQKWTLCREATEIHVDALNSAISYSNKLKSLKEKEKKMLVEINISLDAIEKLEKQN